MKTTELWQKLVDISGWEGYTGAMKQRFNPDPVDPAQFHDSRAFRVLWIPLKTTSVLFPRRFRMRSAFVGSFKLRRFFVITLFLTPMVISAAFYKVWFVVIAWFAVAYPLVIWYWFLGGSPVVFDTKKGVFFKGRRQNQERTPTSDIQALQLLSYFHADVKPIASDVVYQLNVVLASGRRIEVVTQRRPMFRSSRQVIVEDANRLARFLNVPLWDAIADQDR